MKAAVIGSRSFDDYQFMKDSLSKIEITKIVSGGASGADTLAEQYAKENNISIIIFLPNWKAFGKAAGFVRNLRIITEADIIIAFWDGSSKGTKNSIDTANKLNKEVIIVLFDK
jgi:hypothetical protein